MLKKCIIAILSVALIAVSPMYVLAQIPDNTSGQEIVNTRNPDSPADWAINQVNAAIGLGLVPQSMQTYYPRATTRAEFAALAVALYELEKGTITERATFDDTDDISVHKAAAIGVVIGVGNNMFEPEAFLSREQAATMLARLSDAVEKPFPAKEASFADNSSINSWAIEAVGRVQTAEIMNGIGGNMFSPKGAYTREQSIVTIMRSYDFIHGTPGQTNGASVGTDSAQTGAGNAQTGAGSAQTGAGNAQTGAGNAQTGAGNAQTGADGAADPNSLVSTNWAGVYENGKLLSTEVTFYFSGSPQNFSVSDLTDLRLTRNGVEVAFSISGTVTKYMRSGNTETGFHVELKEPLTIPGVYVMTGAYKGKAFTSVELEVT